MLDETIYSSAVYRSAELEFLIAAEETLTAYFTQQIPVSL
jgi:hypothetical protein